MLPPAAQVLSFPETVVSSLTNNRPAGDRSWRRRSWFSSSASPQPPDSVLQNKRRRGTGSNPFPAPSAPCARAGADFADSARRRERSRIQKRAAHGFNVRASGVDVGDEKLEGISRLDRLISACRYGGYSNRHCRVSVS